MDVVVWLAEWLNVKLPRDMRMEMRRELTRAHADARLLVFLLAFSRMHVPVMAARIERPESAPTGFRRARMGGEGRVFRRGLRLHGYSIAARLAELRAVFDNLDRAVRRMLRHLRRRGHDAAIVLVAGAAACLRSVADVATMAADTS